MLMTVLEESFAAHAESIAIIDERGAVTYRELAARADAFASALLRRGTTGDRVAVVSANCVATAVAYLGTLKAAMTPVPINPNLTAGEMAHILAHARPVAMFAAADKLALARSAAAATGEAIATWLTDAESEDGAESMLRLPPAPPHWPAVVPEMGMLMYTSGTTGTPKGVMLAHDAMLAIARAIDARFAFDANDVTTCFLPLFHIYPFVVIFLGSLLRGSKIVMQRGFAFPELLRLVSEHRVTTLMVVPPVVQLLANATWNESEYDLSSLKWIITGGAPMAIAPAQKVMARLGVPVLDGYGITETASVISAGPRESVDHPGAVGQLLDGIAVRICDENGVELPTGEAGEIRVRSPGMMRGYYKDPETTDRVLIDGWFRSGDVGRVDEQGYLYITDRIKDVIFVAGEKVFPREVEEEILAFPGIARAAVVKMDSEATGEAPRAYIVPAPGQTIRVSDLLKHLRERLTAYKLPKKVDIVDQLPTNASGKIQRYKLQDK